MKDLTVIKLPKRLFGKTNCKLQQDKEKVLKPLGSQDFLKSYNILDIFTSQIRTSKSLQYTNFENKTVPESPPTVILALF